MRMSSLLVPLVLASAVVAGAAEPKVIPLWPEGVPGLRADAAEERIVDGRVVGIHYPSLTLYAPEASTANGTAVIYCPGGGYVRLAIGENGGADTKWLNGLGVTVFVLKAATVPATHRAGPDPCFWMKTMYMLAEGPGPGALAPSVRLSSCRTLHLKSVIRWPPGAMLTGGQATAPPASPAW